MHFSNTPVYRSKPTGKSSENDPEDNRDISALEKDLGYSVAKPLHPDLVMVNKKGHSCSSSPTAGLKRLGRLPLVCLLFPGKHQTGGIWAGSRGSPFTGSSRLQTQFWGKLVESYCKNTSGWIITFLEKLFSWKASLMALEIFVPQAKSPHSQPRVCKHAGARHWPSLLLPETGTLPGTGLRSPRPSLLPPPPSLALPACFQIRMLVTCCPLNISLGRKTISSSRGKLEGHLHTGAWWHTWALALPTMESGRNSCCGWGNKRSKGQGGCWAVVATVMAVLWGTRRSFAWNLNHISSKQTVPGSNRARKCSS